MSYYTDNDDISFTPLTLEQEKALFATFYGPAGGAADAARETIIVQHLKLTAKLALGYAKRALQDDDAISAGNEGLMQAVDCRKFRPSDKGARFASYLRTFVRGKVFAAMKSGQNDRSRALRLSSGHKSDDATVTGANADGFSGVANGAGLRAPSADWLSVSEDINPTVQHEAEEKDLADVRRGHIEEGLKRCNEVEAAAIRLVFFKGMTLSEAKRELSKTKRISRQGTTQAYNRGMAILKRYLKRRQDIICP